VKVTVRWWRRERGRILRPRCGLFKVIAAGRDVREVFASFFDTVRKLSAALDRLGAERELLTITEHWRDTLTDAEVLSMLRDYNATRNALQHSQRKRELMSSSHRTRSATYIPRCFNYHGNTHGAASLFQASLR
jgi:lysyl-tRNA synthetase class I